MSNIQKYAEFIAEQQRQLRVAGLISEAEDDEDHKITKKVTREVKKVANHDVDEEPPMHLAKTESGHHVYHAYSEGGDSSYAVHHPSGKVTHHDIDHGNRKITKKDVESDHHIKSVIGDLHPSVKKVIVKDINDNL